MTHRDRLLAATVAALWGINFLAIDTALQHFPPLFLAGLRFFVLAVPTMLLIPRPPVPARWLIGYGFGFGVVEFAFLFIAMRDGMPAGLASLVLQASAPFTVLLGAAMLRERPSSTQLLGVLAAVAGMAVIVWHRAETAAVVPVLLTLVAALGWAFGNLAARKAMAGESVNSVHVTLWMSVVPPIPLFALSVGIEGWEAGWRSLATIATPQGWAAVGGLAYIVLLSTVVATGIWTALMRRNAAGAVAPFSMLVPVVGMSAAWVALGERPALTEVLAGVVIVGGVLLGATRRAARAARRELVLVE